MSGTSPFLSCAAFTVPIMRQIRIKMPQIQPRTGIHVSSPNRLITSD